ncbi:sensor histidine kinase [Phaeodactylibacter luteus]|uniref:histidine kinase n=1 Tax=Phaeodactylibacter luteus TaxID=1564516 RepID=A0A5C6RH66_9BACT|nr:sensor histidine kinase [Phaeodactylibacter luteus]TXB60599.1 hypothetical protein FRY97_20345 [Phaeodactylibacter luteus]
MNKHFLTPILALLLLAKTPTGSNAQASSFEQLITYENGLPGRSITGLVQGPNGFMWISTDNGLCRFDGYRLRTYRSSPEGDSLFQNNFIRFLFQTAQQQLLLINGPTEIELFSPQTETVSRLSVSGAVPGGGILRAVQQMPDQTIFLVAENGQSFCLLELTADGLQLRWRWEGQRHTIPEMNDLNSPRFRLAKGLGGKFWLHDREQGMFLLREQAAGKYQLEKQFGASHFAKPGKGQPQPILCQFVAVDAMGTVWTTFHGQTGLFKYDTAEGSFKPSGLFADVEVTYAYQDQQSHIIFKTESRTTEQTRYVLQNRQQWEPLPMPAPGEVLFVVGRNFRQEIFLGSWQGVARMSPDKPAVTQLLSGMSPLTSIRGMAITAAGRLLLSTERKGWYISQEAIAPDNALPSLEEVRPAAFANGAKDLNPPKFSRNFLPADDGSFWGAAYQLHIPPDVPRGYLIRYYPAADSAVVYPAPYRIECMSRGPDDRIWLAGTSTLMSFDPATGSFTTLAAAKGVLENIDVNYLCLTSDGKIHLGTSVGLFSFDPRQPSPMPARVEKEGLDSRILVLEEHPAGTLWAGTAGEGLIQYDMATGKVQKLSMQDGLPDNNVCGVIPDSLLNGLWLPTFNGLSFYSFEEKAFTNFYTNDGFSNAEFNRFAFLKGPEGLILTGGIDGVNIVDGQALLGRRALPQLFLSSISCYQQQKGEVVTQASNVNEIKNITLPAKNRYLKLEYGLSDFADPGKNRFAYFLEGYDRGWNSIGSRSELIFNNLPPGSYQLHIKGANVRGQWSEPILIGLEVRAFFYQELWFWALLCLLLVGGVWALYQYRLNQMRQLMALRTRIASDLHDDVGGLLAGIAMQTEVMQLNQLLKGDAQLERIRRMSLEAHGRMRDLVWSIDSRRDRIEDLVDRMREQAADVLSGSALKFSLKTEGFPPNTALQAQVRQAIYLIFKEALSNFTKHAAGASSFHVALWKTNHTIYATLSDDGQPQAKPSTPPTGLGLDNIKMRAQQVGGAVEISRDGGFHIKVSIPLAQ